MKYAVSLASLLVATYLLWSGLATPFTHHFHPLLLWLGLASIAVVMLIAVRMGLVDAEGTPVEMTNFRVVLYVPWLVLEILKANVDVARRILAPGLPISPEIIRVPASQQTEIAQVLYANSITLTPGTVSINVDGGTITVHALTRDAAAGVESDEMNRRVAALEGGG